MLNTTFVPQKTKKRSGRRFGLLVLFLLALLAFSLAKLDAKIRPVAMTMAEYQSRNRCVEAVRTAVLASLEQAPASYDALYHIQRAEDGSILSIVCDTRQMNQLQVRLEQAADLALAEIAAHPLAIPLGTLSGLQLLSAKGPVLQVRSLPLSAVESRVDSRFSSAGINQTRLEVDLVFSVEMQVLLAGVSGHTQFESRVPVAQMVLVGDTPNFYAETT